MELLLILSQKIVHYLNTNKILLVILLQMEQMEKKGVKIALSLKYLSNFRRSLEIPLINCKVELSLKWHEICILSSAETAVTFETTDTKLYVLIVTLSAEDNVKLSKLLGKGFKRSIYWNKYKVILNKRYNANQYIRELLDSSYQGVQRLFLFFLI